MAEVKKSNTDFSLIAGIIFAILTVLQLVYFRYGFSIYTLFYSLSYAGTAFLLFTKRRDLYLGVALAVPALLKLLLFFRGFSFGAYRIDAFMGNGRFSFFCILPYLMIALGSIALSVFCFAELTNYLPQIKAKAKELWFVPAALLAAGPVFALILRLMIRIFSHYWIYGRSVSGFREFLFAAGALLVAMWVEFPAGMPEKASSEAPSYSAGESHACSDEAYCGLVKHILLLLFTCGIWYLIWIYKMTGYTNAVRNEEKRNPTTKLLLCMFIPFYNIYWTYKTAQRIDQMAREKRMASDLATLCLILSIFVPIIPPILMQDKMNSIVAQKNGMGENYYEEKLSPKLGTAEELQKFKDLLDNGVITQEEFDAKKKQLLGL